MAFGVWLLLLRIMFPRLTYVYHVLILLSFQWLKSVPLYRYTTFYLFLHQLWTFKFASFNETLWVLTALKTCIQVITCSFLFFLFFVFFLFFGFFLLFRAHPRHMAVPRLGVKSELHLPAYAIAIATRDLSCLCNLYSSSWQRWIPNPLSEARDQTHILMDPSQVR